jgi:hypothetical protein
MQRSIKRLARNARRISISAIYTGATVTGTKTDDLGWMKIDIDPSAQVTKFGLLVGLPGPRTITKPCSFSTITISCSVARVCHAVVGFSSLLSRVLRDLLVE